MDFNLDYNTVNEDLLKAASGFWGIHGNEIKILLRYCADVDTQDQNGNTPLMLSQGNYTDFQLLLRNSADPLIKNNDGRNIFNKFWYLEKREIEILIEELYTRHKKDIKSIVAYVYSAHNDLKQLRKVTEDLQSQIDGLRKIITDQNHTNSAEKSNNDYILHNNLEVLALGKEADPAQSHHHDFD